MPRTDNRPMGSNAPIQHSALRCLAHSAAGRPRVRARRAVAGLLGLVCLLAGSVDAADWTTYRGGNDRPSATSERLSMPLGRLWTEAAPAPPRTSWSGPDDREIEGHELRHRVLYDDAFHVAAAGGRVYFGSSVDHAVRCRDAATGSEQWRFYTGGPVRLAPCVWEDRVLFGSDDGFVYCVEATTGRLVWKLRAGPTDDWFIGRGEMISRWPVRTGVLVADGIAYFGAGLFPHEDVFLYAVSAADGRVIWKRDNISESEAGRNDLSPQGYLLASDELLFVPSGRSLPAAVDLKSGEIVHKGFLSWRREGGGPVGGVRALLSDGQLYAAGDHHTVAMDQRTGEAGFGWFDSREMAVAGDFAILADGEHVTRVERLPYAVESRNRQKLKQQAFDARRSLLRAQRDPESYTDADIERLKQEYRNVQQEVNKSRDASRVWQTPCTLQSALLITADHVIAGGSDRVAAFDLQTGNEVWSADVAGDARGLAAAGGLLFVSTTSGHVTCFGSAEPPTAAQESGQLTQNPFPRDDWSLTYETAAEEILEQTGIRRGYCLVVGSEQGRLAYELARRSDLKILGIEPDAEKVRQSRDALAAAGLYGNRVVIHHRDVAEIPYSNYFANLIVSDSLLATGRLPGPPTALARHLKPSGGMVCIGQPASAPLVSTTADDREAFLVGMELQEQGTLQARDGWTVFERGPLPGAGSWSHLYAEPGNTASSEDRRIKGGLGVLWFGDPGPGKMVNRHEGAVGPLAINGRLFVQGHQSVMAYDAYNGQFLWERGNAEAQRTGVFQNYNPGNLVASDDSLFVMVRDKCLQLDAATGDVRATFGIPGGIDQKSYEWGYLAYRDGRLFGTATVREELALRQRRRGRVTQESTDAIFAIDVDSGRHLWTYTGGSISHHTIALGPDRVFFIDSSITPETRAALLREDKTDLKQLGPEEAQAAEERLKRLDARLAVALDAVTGETIWSKPVDVTDCSEIGTGGGQLTLMHQNNVLVLCGANANGHYWKQFLEGEFSQRRLVALSTEDGRRLWAKDANYRHRPIIVEDRIIAEPWGFDLYTGAQQMREHPLTGEPVPWSIIRPGHHCGMLTGCPSMLLFRSGFTGFYDLEQDAGTRHFAGHRLGCWINAIPANGLVMIPEASAGCVCLFSIAATITLEPREPRRPWAIFSAIGRSTPVSHMALNLGAPGDRRDSRGTAWLAYPRPRPGKETGLDLELDLKQSFGNGGQFMSKSEQSTPIDNTQTPWLFTSAARGLSQLTLPLLGEGDSPATYKVTLYFAELDEPHGDGRRQADNGPRLFDVKLQGETVIANLNVAAEADGPRKALVREVAGVAVNDNLLVELVPRTAGDTSTLLNAIEVVRE